MKKTMCYINTNINRNEIVYMGITFYEFIEYLQNSIKNILLLKSDYIGNKCLKNFELVEGEEDIELLKNEYLDYCGDFCFVDYSNYENINKLTDIQIAELLYMAHMFKPLKSPFYDVLNNRFVYMAHDDDFFCKLYCREFNDFFDVLNGKIVSLIKNVSNKCINKFDVNMKRSLLKLSEEGILLDFEEININDIEVAINIYSIGKHINMDKIINKYKYFKETAIKKMCLKYKDEKWCLE